MEIVWQTPANPPERQDYIFQKGMIDWRLTHLIEIVNEVGSGVLIVGALLFVPGRRLVRPYYFEFISHVRPSSPPHLFLHAYCFRHSWLSWTSADYLTGQESMGRPNHRWFLHPRVQRQTLRVLCTSLNLPLFDFVFRCYMPPFLSHRWVLFVSVPAHRHVKVSAVQCGRIQVDGETVPVSCILKPSQKISHFLHRLLPILSSSILLHQALNPIRLHLLPSYFPPSFCCFEFIWLAVWLMRRCL